MADDKPPRWGRGVATGFEMAVGVVLGYFAGHWLDERYGWDPWGSLIGGLLGLIAGAYILIKEVNRDNKQQP